MDATNKENTRKRKNKITIRLTDEELEIVKNKIELSNLTTQEFVLRCLLGKKIVQMEELREYTITAKRTGNLLNQIMRNYYAKHGMDSQALEICIKELSETWLSLKQYLGRKDR